MRRVKIFSGSSNVQLTDAICERLGMAKSKCELRKFANGETSVEIGVSIRDQDVFIVQGGSGKINDHLMETLILISACKGGSANKVTAVIPYFPYSKQSKKKKHRGAITARMVANLLTIAGVDHVVTVDLHASQMQGFFTRPVDNLSAEPLIAKWIRTNIAEWRDAVIVSKNPGGTKRVTSLADALKLNFALITTDKRRAIHDSAINSRRHSPIHSDSGKDNKEESAAADKVDGAAESVPNGAAQVNGHGGSIKEEDQEDGKHSRHLPRNSLSTFLHHRRTASGTSGSALDNTPHRPSNLSSSRSIPHPDSHLSPSHEFNGTEEEEGDDEKEEQEFNDEQAEVTTGRLVQGHIVEDDYEASPSMMNSIILEESSMVEMSASGVMNPILMSSIMSTTSSVVGMDSAPLGGTIDARESDDEDDQHMAIERMITLVGEVKGRVAIIVDDMIDRPGSWIAAAEHCIMRCRAKKVYCIATHGLFGDGCLKEMEECKHIHQVVVTNSFPVSDEQQRMYRKLRVLDLSHLLSEAIRRNHHGEPISTLFQHFD